MSKLFALNLGWIVAAALVGFAITAVFAGVFRLARNVFLVVYLALVTPFLYAFVRWSHVSIGELIRHNWIWGLVGRRWQAPSWSAIFFRNPRRPILRAWR